MIRVLLALLLLFVAGCTHCPLRLFEFGEHTCPWCGETIQTHMGYMVDHKCKDATPVAGTKESK